MSTVPHSEHPEPVEGSKNAARGRTLRQAQDAQVVLIKYELLPSSRTNADNRACRVRFGREVGTLNTEPRGNGRNTMRRRSEADFVEATMS